MSFIIETEEQLHKLIPEEDSFIQIITGNDNFHPKLSHPVAIYYRTKERGYLINISHTEALSINAMIVREWLVTHSKTVYCLDKKALSYYINMNAVDLGFVIMDKENKIPEFEIDPQCYRDFYRKHPYRPDVNELIPITKVFERYENLYSKISSYIGERYQGDEDIMVEVYKKVEEQGIGINQKQFDKYLEPTFSSFSIKDNKIYSSYNLYNLTSRPTNAFNSVNFLALNKEDKTRSSIVPKGDMFIELDFEAYHLKLIAKIVGMYQDTEESIHKLLAKELLGKEDITEEEYQEVKAINFKQIYGGISEEYIDVPFFKKIKDLQGILWEEYERQGGLYLPTGRWLKKNEDLYPQKLFNYYIQNLETSSNVYLLEKILKILEDYKSKVVLVVYDSLLIDFNVEDTKEPILKIRELIQSEGLSAKFKYGKDYNSLLKTNYL